MALFLILQDFQAGGEVHFRAGDLLDETLQPIAALQAGGLAVIEFAPATMQEPLDQFLAYRNTRNDIGGEYLSSLLLEAGAFGVAGTPTGTAGGDLEGTYPNPRVQDLTITGELQGSVLYFDGTNWVQLQHGTPNQVLTTQGLTTAPIWRDLDTILPDDIVTGFLTEGSGEPLTRTLVSNTLTFKSIVAGSGIALSSDSNELTIEATGGGGGSIDDVVNVGTGADVVRDVIAGVASLRSLLGDSTLDVAVAGDEITLGVASGVFLPIAGGTMTGTIDMGAQAITNAGAVTSTGFSGPLTGDVTGDVNTVSILTDGPATQFLDRTGGYSVPVGSGGDFSGPAGSTAGNLVSFADVTGKLGADSGIVASTLTGGPFLPLTGGTMSGDIDMGANSLTEVGGVTAPNDADLLVSSSGTGGAILATLGSGETTVTAAGTGEVVIEAQANNVRINVESVGELQMGVAGAGQIVVDVNGAVAFVPTSGQDFAVTTAGGGNAVLNAYTFPDLNVDTFSFPDAQGTAGAVLTDVAGDGVLTFVVPPNGSTLQAVYANGNTIAVTAADGTVSISNAADTADTLSVARTFAGAGDGVVVNMATGTSGRGVNITMDVGSSGNALRVNQNGGGTAMNVTGTGTSQLQVSSAGAVTVASATGQTVDVNAYTFPDLTGDAFSMPSADGSDGQALTTDGAGNLAFETVVAATPPLQDVYAAGNTIDVTAGNGAVSISNATDLTDTLAVSRTFAGSGDAISVNLATGTTGRGARIVMDAGSTGTALRVDQNGSGTALNVTGTGTSQLQVDSAGAVTVASATGQNVAINTYTFPDLTGDAFTMPNTQGAGGAVLTDTLGDGVLTWVVPTGGGATLQTAYDMGAGTIATTAGKSISFSNAVDVTDLLTLARTFAGAGEALAIDMATGTTGTGAHITMDAGSTGSALHINQGGSGIVVQFDQGASNRFLIDGSGAVFLASAAGQNAIIRADGSGDAVIGTIASGDVIVEAVGTGDAIVRATAGTVTIDATAGAVDITSGTGFDVTIATAGAGSADINAWSFPASAVVFTAPIVDGNDGDVLTTDGAGVLTFVDPGLNVSLQEAYVTGNSIDVTTANDTVLMGNAADTTDVLTLSRSFAGAGEALRIDMATGTTGDAAGITVAAGSTSTALRIDQDGSGIALDVQGTGLQQLLLNASGAVFIESDSGQNVTVTGSSNVIVVATAGNASMDAVAGSVLIDALSLGGVSLQVASVTKLNVSVIGTVSVTPTDTRDFIVTTTGGGISDFNGPVEISDATAIDTLAINKSGAVAGDGLSVTMATGTTGHGAHITMEAGSTGTGLRVDQDGGGGVFDFRGAGISSMALDAAGIFDLQTANAQAATLRTGTTGVMRFFSGGTLTADSTTGNVELQDNGDPRWVSTQTGSIDVTPGSGEDFTATAVGGGALVFNGPVQVNDSTAADGLVITKDVAGSGRGIHVAMATGTTGSAISTTLDAGSSSAGLFVEQLGSGIVAQFNHLGNTRFELGAGGFIVATAADDQNAIWQTGGTGIAEVRTNGSGSAILSANSGDARVISTSGDVVLDAVAGQLVFDDIGNSGLTLSQASDLVLTQTGAGEIQNGTTSIVAAVNRLSEVALPIVGFQGGLATTSGNTFIAKTTITLPAGAGIEYIIDGTMAVSHDSTNMRSEVRIRNVTTAGNVAEPAVTEMKDVNEVRRVGPGRIRMAGLVGIQVLELQYALQTGSPGGTLSTRDAMLTATPLG